jgi:hypothetical protein
METQFSLDMHKASSLIIEHPLAGRSNEACEEVEWIRAHSAPSEVRDALLATLSRDWDDLAAGRDAPKIGVRIAALRDAAIKAGPSAVDGALMRY